MGRLSYFRTDSAVNEAHKEAIETGFPCILLCKKVIGEGGGKIERGVLFDILALGLGAYSGEGAYSSMGAYSRKYCMQRVNCRGSLMKM